MKGDCLRPNLITTNIHTKIKQQKKNIMVEEQQSRKWNIKTDKN